MGVILPKRGRIFDIALLVIIIVMGYFVYLELDRMLHDLRNTQRSASHVAAPNPTKMTLPTLTDVSIPEARPAPDFELESLEGEMLTLSNLRGQVVMINFWATWCYPCQAEFPIFENFKERYKGKLVVLAVNTGEGKDRVGSFVEEFGFDLIFLLDQANTTSSLFRIRGLPTTVFVDVDGNLRATHIGELDENQLTTYLNGIGINE